MPSAGFFLTELKVVEVHFRRETHSFSLSELPGAISLFLVPPEKYFLAVVVGSGAAFLVSSRHSFPKLSFNLANYLLGAVVTIAVFRTVGMLDLDPQLRDWTAAFARPLPAAGLARLLGLAPSEGVAEGVFEPAPSAVSRAAVAARAGPRA